MVKLAFRFAAALCLISLPLAAAPAPPAAAGAAAAPAGGRLAAGLVPAVTAAARAADDERDTHSYVLIGGDNLQAHLGKRVEVVGTLSGKTQDMEQKTTRETESAPTSGKDTPTVKTKEEVDLEVRQLNVREVRDVAPTCEVK